MEHPIIINAISKPSNPLKVCITIGMEGGYLPDNIYTIEVDGLLGLRKYLIDKINSLFGDIPEEDISFDFNFDNPYGMVAIIDEGRSLNTIVEVFETDEEDEYELDKILELHKKWLNNSIGGKRANLRDANLRGTDLSDTDLRDANLRGTDLRNTNLRGTDLRNTNLIGTDLRKANLRNANLSGVNLSYVYLSGVDLRDADLSDVTMNWNSHDLISERLLQASKNEEQVEFAKNIKENKQHCWDWWAENTPNELKFWAIEEMKKWIKEGDDVPKYIQNS